MYPAGYYYLRYGGLSAGTGKLKINTNYFLGNMGFH
jgi:hypothetical protein